MARSSRPTTRGKSRRLNGVGSVAPRRKPKGRVVLRVLQDNMALIERIIMRLSASGAVGETWPSYGNAYGGA